MKMMINELIVKSKKAVRERQRRSGENVRMLVNLCLNNTTERTSLKREMFHFK